jgi:hypothetical protein
VPGPRAERTFITGPTSFRDPVKMSNTDKKRTGIPKVPDPKLLLVVEPYWLFWPLAAFWVSLAPRSAVRAPPCHNPNAESTKSM